MSTKPELPPRNLYPPRQSQSLSNNPSSHAPSSSISSFHSVSLSSDTDTILKDLDQTPTLPHPKNHEADNISLTESYENVSNTSLASPATERSISLDWEKAMAKRKALPPKLPKRPPIIKSSPKPPVNSPLPPPYPVRRVAPTSLSPPTTKPTPSTSSSFATSYTPRRVAPPPPPSRSSDRSSITSTTTTYSFSSGSQSHQSHNLYSPSLPSSKAKRPTPVPLAARKRYEAVFNANILQRRKAEKGKQQEKPTLLNVTEARSRRAVGWRGLSVDLLTANDVPQQLDRGDGTVIHDIVGPDEKLEGLIIKRIWKNSGLDNSRLADIWYVLCGSFHLNYFDFLLITGMAAIRRVRVLLVLRLLSKACGELTKSSDECSHKLLKQLALLTWAFLVQTHVAHTNLEISFADRMF